MGLEWGENPCPPIACHMKTDGEIVAETLAGHRDLFAEIVLRYEPALKRVAMLRLGRVDWSEDVVQETFYWAYRCLESYDSRYSFRTWLWTILLNQCKRYQQKQHRTPTVAAWTDHHSEPTEDLEKSGTEPTPAAQLLRKERDAILRQHLAALAEEEADAIRLRFFGGLKFQEIADAMGCSLSCAKNRVRRGLLKMSDQLRPSTNGTSSAPVAHSATGGNNDEL